MPDQYDESSIRILSPQEFTQRFEWAEVGALAAQHKSDPSFIRRGFKACDAAGAERSYFVDRYLKGDKSVPFNVEVDAAFRQSWREDS
jgi:hypothetical protein